MSDILILNEADLRRAAPLDPDAIGVIEDCFRALAGPGVIMPPVLSMHMPQANGEVDVKTAYLPGMDAFAIKISPGFFDNPKLGLPSLNGMMVLLSARTGLVEAVLLDNGYLTNLRTAAAGAVAARHLAPEQVEVAGVIGAGAQARLQLIAAHMARPFQTALVWSRNAERSAEARAEIAAATGADVRIADSAEEVVRAAGLVVTATPSQRPVVMADWLHPGLHITCMGSDQDGKNEIDAAALARADLYVCDRVDQCAGLGELRAARAAGFLTDVTPPELGQIVTGETRGRRGPDDITICDLTGTGAQDTAIANLARMRALAADAGTTFAR